MRALLLLLIRIFPADFRRTFGADMLATFDDRWRERASWRLAASTIADLFRTAALLHLAALRQPDLGNQNRLGKGDGLMIALAQDLRFAFRMLWRGPVFTAVVVAVLAIGIGANSAIFSLLDAALFRPLPFAQPDQLVMLWEHPPSYAHNRVSPLNFLDWSEQNNVFESMAAVSGGSRTLITSNGPERIPGQSVSASLFDLLGIRPVAGRTFTKEDIRQRAHVVVLSERLWTSQFGRDPRLVGSTLTLDGELFTVIGIVPSQFQILSNSNLWTIFEPKRSPEQRRMHYLQVIGRLKHGVNLDSAKAGMGVVAENIARISPATNKDWGITIEPLRDALSDRDLRVTSLVLGSVVGFVLLMACANVASLMLARGAGRRREIAVRASLGGSQVRILRQLLTESTLLGLLGGIAGVALAWLILRAAPSFLPPGLLPVSWQLALDGRVLAFAAVLTLATGLLFGFAPAWHAARTSISDALRTGDRNTTAGSVAFRASLATGEIAVALVLVTGAGLLLRTLGSLNHVDAGYYATNVLTMSVGLPLSRYPVPQDTLSFYQAVQSEIGALPGVQNVSLSTNLPTDGWDIGQGFNIVGHPPPGEANQQSAHYQMVSASYFATLGIPILRGRAFTERDTLAATPVCIVNEELVRRYLNGQEPIGALISVQAMTSGGPKPVVRQVVGVSHQVKVEGLGEKQNDVEIYVPITQNSWYWAAIAVRAATDPLSLAPAVKSAIARVDKDQPVTRIRTMDEIAAGSIAQPRFRAQLVAAFAFLAMLLASVGVFGVLAFSVGQRTREFGIRMALGASTGDVLRLVLRSGLKMIAIGLGIGFTATLALTQSLQSVLFGVKPMDPLTFVTAAATLIVVALMACAIPALRAARVDPASALRQE
jgi:putative ABC transport system permease protein